MNPINTQLRGYLHTLRSGLESKRIEAMRQIWIMITKSGHAVLSGCVDELIALLADQLRDSFGASFRVRLCKYAINTTMVVIKKRKLTTELSVPTLVILFRTILQCLLTPYLRYIFIIIVVSDCYCYYCFRNFQEAL